MTTLMGAATALLSPFHAQGGDISDGSPIYFVPGGRIGFRKPPEIDVWSNRCSLATSGLAVLVAIANLKIDGLSGEILRAAAEGLSMLAYVSVAVAVGMIIVAATLRLSRVLEGQMAASPMN